MNRGQMTLVICIFISVFLVISIILIKTVKTKFKIQISATIMTLIAIAAISVFIFYTTFGDYDRLGNRYNNYRDVLYYSKAGKLYKVDGGDYYGESYYVNIRNPKERYRDTISFISKDGFIFFDDKGKNVISAKKDDVAIYIDGKGNECYGASFVTFGWTGAITA